MITANNLLLKVEIRHCPFGDAQQFSKDDANRNQFRNVLITKDENIGNHGYMVLRFYGYIGYIGDILDISEIYRRYIGGYFGKKYWCLKLLKTHENIKKTS